MSNLPTATQPPPAELIATSAAAELLGITPRHVARLVDRGALVPALKLPGKTGAYLFDPDAILEAARA